ncbi:hypothetical protein SRB5_17440 [Streptomyces sp. RB5]|uniref:Right handed beta helix domain-containing protein n=1 Tax=Streptomyces smaragdinus TaxID=2585196 RepID=A0A7K0CDT4_9ACTN|nr:right-handed parallel beta-helix repeat-containing protein [Streptomyces smaragdinus]MQY11625.1 hypothetical protein [Streptomyces smaragdinus]
MFEHRSRGRRGGRWTAAASLAAVAALLSTGPATAVETKPKPLDAVTYYVDCAQGNDSAAGTSAATAWKTLAKANTQTLGYGESLLIKGGTACTGMLQPRGSGTSNYPITIGSYGNGKGRIDANGALAAVYLANVQYYRVHDLELTNTAATPGQRFGLYAKLTDYGTGHGYQVSGLNIHDVDGEDVRFPNPNGGIVFEAAGTTKATGFSQVSITGNVLQSVDRTGIAAFSSWQRRAQVPGGTGTYVPITGLMIGQNQLRDIGGDGIVVFNGQDAWVYENLIDGFGMRTADYTLGIHGWNSDRTHIERNEIAHGRLPSLALGVEGGSTDAYVRFNYTHDNPFGMLYICGANSAEEGSTTSGATISYNVSRNDGGEGFAVVVTTCVNMSGIEIYNNSVYSPNARAFTYASGTTALRYTNNIFSGSSSGSLVDDPYSTYRYNLFHHVAAGAPTGTNAVLADPRFVNPALDSADGIKLADGSPAIGAGVEVTGEGPYDYWGQPMPLPRNIGADLSP